MERLTALGLIDAALVGRDTVNVGLEVEVVVLVSFHQLKHAVPVGFLESHVAVVVSKGIEYLHLGQEAAPRDIDLTENVG